MDFWHLNQNEYTCSKLVLKAYFCIIQRHGLCQNNWRNVIGTYTWLLMRIQTSTGNNILHWNRFTETSQRPKKFGWEEIASHVTVYVLKRKSYLTSSGLSHIRKEEEIHLAIWKHLWGITIQTSSIWLT